MNKTEPKFDFALTIARRGFGSNQRTDDMNDELNARALGQYPWDDWERAAQARGVEKELANRGRAVMREAYQHDWPERLQSLCGWRDGGRRMIALALRAPETARQRWKWLLQTDGERVHPQTLEWIGEGSWRWPRVKRDWQREAGEPALDGRSE